MAASSPFLLLLLLSYLCFLPSVVYGQSYRNVSLTSSLTAGDKDSSPSSWASPSGEFAFGFHRLPQLNLFLLAIWYEKLPEKTVVWYVNGNNPLQSGSKVELTSRGELVLTDHQGREQWKQDSLSGNISHAAMLDTGNFVMISTNFRRVWQSFDEPSDTILPTQRLDPPRVLSSRRGEANFSKGRFELGLQTDGNLVLYPLSFKEQVYPAYWESNTVGTGVRLIFNESGSVYLQQSNGSRFNLGSTTDTLSTGDFYQRMTLEFNGIFSLFVYPKTSKSGNWEKSWSILRSIPPNMCMIRWQDTGPGACGFNSYCELDEQKKPKCLCPIGYTYFDPNDPLGGCKPTFPLQSCDFDGAKRGLQTEFVMRAMVGTDWSIGDFEYFDSVTEDECRQACLADCLCYIARYRDNTCWKKRLPFSNGRRDSSILGKALIKVPAGNFTPSSVPSLSDLGGKRNNRGTLLVLLSVFLGSSAFLNFLLLSLVLLGFSMIGKRKKKVAASVSEVYGAVIISNFSYKELEKATNGFKQVLGRGGSGTVYKGSVLPSSRFVAVKELDKLPKDKDEEFKNEMQVISRVHHKNLVPLLGFCDEEHHRLLVYEFMNNGSLSGFLFGDSKPSWNQRLRIMFGVARGLLYLHEECQTQIIHCDIKPENVLLDETFTPRIADFGLAKLLGAEQTRTTTGIRGTKGYVAPEWFKSMPITTKVDVYSFGILLLEIIFCRKNVVMNSDEEEKAILSDWVCDCYNEGRLDVLVEDDEEAVNDFKKVERLVKVAIWCIQDEPSLRPSMKKVTQMLEGAVEVSHPPHPYSYISSID